MNKILLFTFLFLAATGSATAASQTVTLSIPDMNCPSCPITIKKALSKVEGVSKVQVNLEKHQAIIDFDNAKTSIDKLTNATEMAGYPSTVKHP